jgi:hypothetical protein
VPLANGPPSFTVNWTTRYNRNVRHQRPDCRKRASRSLVFNVSRLDRSITRSDASPPCESFRNRVPRKLTIRGLFFIIANLVHGFLVLDTPAPRLPSTSFVIRISWSSCGKYLPRNCNEFIQLMPRLGFIKIYRNE